MELCDVWGIYRTSGNCLTDYAVPVGIAWQIRDIPAHTGFHYSSSNQLSGQYIKYPYGNL